MKLWNCYFDLWNSEFLQLFVENLVHAWPHLIQQLRIFVKSSWNEMRSSSSEPKQIFKQMISN